VALSATALPALRGGLLALLAAALFGVSMPLVQQFGAGLGPFSTAALLYAGAAAVGALSRQPIGREARLQRGDLPRLVAMAGFGAVVGPVALAWGLQNTSGTSASLMLTLEALFTAVLAWRLYRETMDGRVWTAMALLLAGGMVLVLDQGRAGGSQLWGLLAVLLATAAWGVDNTLSRALATGYGLSLRFYLLAQRAFGAARTGSVFAFAPFIGAAFAVALGDRSASGMMALGSALMLAGVVLHLAESHGYAHAHDALDHEHAHRHDDGHHDHLHDPMPAGEHSHRHGHEPVQHAHAHVPDAHHAHRH